MTKKLNKTYQISYWLAFGQRVNEELILKKLVSVLSHLSLESLSYSNLYEQKNHVIASFFRLEKYTYIYIHLLNTSQSGAFQWRNWITKLKCIQCNMNYISLNKICLVLKFIKKVIFSAVLKEAGLLHHLRLGSNLFQIDTLL